MRAPPIADLAVAAALVAACQVEMWVYEDGPRGTVAVTVAAAAIFPALVSLRRAAPELMVGLASFVMVTQAMLGGRMTTTLAIAFSSMLVMFTTGSRLPGRRSVVAAVAFLAACWLDVAVVGPADYGLVSDLVFTGVIVGGGPFLAGVAVRVHQDRGAELLRANALLEDQAERLARSAVLEERARIAREMHDVVSHSVSLMVVQAGAARHLLRRELDQSETALLAVEEVGRDALVELRRVLGVLRDEGATAALSPRPGTSQIGDLVDRARASGQPVTYDVSGEPGVVPAGADVAAYRVVQEALTNAVRHASGAATSVRLTWSPDALDLLVVDAGGGSTAQDTGAGQGLLGMRERVQAYGGRLHAGPSDAGGFEVRARLPLGPGEGTGG